MASALRLAAIACLGAAAANAWNCGVDDPVVGPDLARVEAAVVPQEYETPEQLATARRLAPQLYGDSASFVPIALADAAGWTRPLRVVIVWDVIDSGDQTGVTTSRRMCTTLGEVIEVKNGGSWVQWTTANFPDTDPCGTKAVVGGSADGTARYLAMKERTNAAVGFWQNTVKVKPVRDNIILDSYVSGEFGLAPGTSYPNADLVIIMTARPSPASPIAGFAVCYQRDQRGRCTVGHFNWVPEVVDVEHFNNPDTEESELHTALHELMHVLGGMSPGSTSSSSPFLDDNGLQRTSGVFLVQDDPAYPTATGKKRTLIITPKVANFTRGYFGCDAALGFPIEDVPLGKGSHWEARVAGPELMSYGSGSGQVYISDLTLAFLEDTNQYIADYSKAGPIVAVGDDDEFAGMAGLAFLQKNEAPVDYTPPPPPPPGEVRWGYNAGCEFLDTKPSATTWPKEYLCNKNKVYGCTPDRRMSAVCVIKGDYVAAEQSCGEYRQDGTGANCIAAGTGVPDYMQPFATDADASAASGIPGATVSSTGGYNNAMDYAPVMVGYWNCMYSTPKANNSGSLGGGDTGASLREFVSSFGQAADMATFGGQARCPQCRCLQSSLMELTKGYNPAEPEYGLCYRTNCYRPDYLQIAVKSSLGTDASFWYACPLDGGKLYIPGFTGSLVCPPTLEFCSQETITGVRHPEQNVVFEAIFWGGICAFCALTFLICAMPCLRDRVINCTKRCCGARVFEVVQPKGVNGAPPPLPKISSRILMVANGLALLVGLALTAACSYAIYIGSPAALMPLLSMGILTTMLSGIGLRASCKKAEHGPSCYLLTYFLSDVLLVTLLVWTVVYSFAFTDWTDIAEKRYDTLVSYLPDNLKNGTRDENIDNLRHLLEKNQYSIAGVFVGIFAVLLITLGAAGKMVHGRTLITMFITFLNNIAIVFGALMLIVGLYFVAFKAQVVAGATPVVAIVIVTGAFFVVLGAVGHAGVFKRSVKLLYVFMGLQIILGGLAAAATAICFKSTTDVSSYVSSLDDKALGAIASAFGFALTSQQIVAKIQGNLHQLGLAFAVLLILQVVLFINTNLLLWALRISHLAGDQQPVQAPSVEAGIKVDGINKGFMRRPVAGPVQGKPPRILT